MAIRDHYDKADNQERHRRWRRMEADQRDYIQRMNTDLNNDMN